MSSSDSSEDEDLSRFRDVVDTSFIKSLSQPTAKLPEQRHHSERYLEVSSHYNDVKVPDKLQKQIGDKISAILSKTIEYVDVQNKFDTQECKIEGGVKLFRDSKAFLSCEEISDNYTESHNMKSKKLKSKPKKRFLDIGESEEPDKMKSVAVSGDYILSKLETKYWKSRRKEKVYKYKANGKSKTLVAVE